MKITKRKQKVMKIIIVVLVVIIILMTAFIIYKKFISKSSTSGSKVKVVDKIDNYGYYLEDNDPKEYKDMYYQLQDVLNSKTVDEEAYAKLVARMLVFDFYNIDNKISKNDIGGTQFVIEQYRENFILEASETVYKYVEHNIYGDRTQKLPKVTKTTATDLKKATYAYNDIKDDNCYIIKVDISYEEDLGYPTTVEVKLLHNNDKLEVFYMK